MPQRRLRLDSAAQLLDVPPDHIHTDAPTGDIGDLLCSGEPGRKDQLEYFSFGELGVRCYEIAFFCFAANLLAVQSTTVIGNLDDDEPSLMARGQANLRLQGFAGSLALGRGFDPVVNGVPHHVQERVGQLFRDGFVDLRVRACRFQDDLLAGFAREIADDALDTLEDASNGDHPHTHRGTLHLPGYPSEVGKITKQAGVGGGREGLIVTNE